MDQPEAIYSQPVLDMFTVANEYTIFIEKATSYEKAEVYNYFLKILPLLYLKGALVPTINVEYPEANERYVTEEQWQNIFNELRLLFDEEDEFYYCDPSLADAEPVKQSLAENLADIYQDMKDFVLLYSKEMQAARENAVHEIARLFKAHWGHRVLIAMMHLHFILNRNHIEADEFF